jgi:IS1 family transposase
VNVLAQHKQIQVLRCIVEGNSVRATERLTGVHRDTIIRLVNRIGRGCDRILDREMWGLECRSLQIDEIWGYVGKKEARLTLEDNRFEMGDQYVFVAICPESKLVPVFHVGKRTREVARRFLQDLSPRFNHRLNISTDAFNGYPYAVAQAYGRYGVDFGQIAKSYGLEDPGRGRYAPPRVVSVTKETIFGQPDEICTSHVERNNLTMRMQIRRLTRLTNAFSRKWENYYNALALHFAHYNLQRRHGTIKTTPAQAAGISDHAWGWEELLFEADIRRVA